MTLDAGFNNLMEKPNIPCGKVYIILDLRRH